MILTESTFLLFASKHYDNPQCADISEFEELCSGVTRRTLQRDLNALIKLNLVQLMGSARQSCYELV